MIDNKNNVYNAIVEPMGYSDKLKSNVFKVFALYNLDGEAVKDFDVVNSIGALLEESDSVGEEDKLPNGFNQGEYYEVLVEDTYPKEPLKTFKISSGSKFIPACLLCNAKWIRKKDNLFVSTNGVVQLCKKLGYFSPVDKEEAYIYSKVVLDDENKFCAEDGVIRKYKIENLDFLNSTGEIRKNIYAMSQASFDSIEKSLVEEIDFIDKEKLKGWFIEATEVDKEVIAEAVNKINNEGLTEETSKIRIERCRKMFENFTFSKEDLSRFFSRKKFKKELDDYKNERKHQIDTELNSEKQRRLGNIDIDLDEERKRKLEIINVEFKEKYDAACQKLVEKEDVLKSKNAELNDCVATLDKVKKELVVKEESLKTLSDEIDRMETTKNMIVETLKEIVRNQQPASSRKEDDGDTYVNDMVFFERADNIAEVDDDNYKTLFPSDLDREQRKALADILSHKASIIPDISYAYTLANFMTNTHLNIITVEHGWYHYEDFVKAGVLDFYNNALADNEHNYLLVLENINIVPIECAFKPLIDLLHGARLNLPGATALAFPKNLRILATVLPSASEDAFGIKLNEDAYSGFHFVETPESKLSKPLDWIINTASQRYYVNLKSVTIDDTEDDNGYSNYKDY